MGILRNFQPTRIVRELENSLKESETVEDINKLYKNYLGKNGYVNQVFSEVNSIKDNTKRKALVKRIFNVQDTIKSLIERRRTELSQDQEN